MVPVCPGDCGREVSIHSITAWLWTQAVQFLLLPFSSPKASVPTKLERPQPRKRFYQVLRLEYERSRHDDIGTGAAQERHGMGADAAVGDQPDASAPFANHGRRACKTVAGFRRQILAFDAEHCTEQK
jgi:hypothetical protein